MAVRLPVIVSQSAGGSNEQQGIEAGAVIQLMGLPGIDVSLIGPLGTGTLSSTDQLVLESQDRSFAIVAAEPPADTMAALRSLGLAGRRAAHPHDPEGETGQGRRVFCLHWADFDSSEAICQALQQILKDQQVVAVPIGLGAVGTGKTRKTEGTTRTPGTGTTEEPVSKPSPTTSPSPATSPAAHRVSNSDLDDLVEDLNDLNL